MSKAAHAEETAQATTPDEPKAFEPITLAGDVAAAFLDRNRRRIAAARELSLLTKRAQFESATVQLLETEIGFLVSDTLDERGLSHEDFEVKVDGDQVRIVERKKKT